MALAAGRRGLSPRGAAALVALLAAAAAATAGASGADDFFSPLAPILAPVISKPTASRLLCRRLGLP